MHDLMKNYLQISPVIPVVVIHHEEKAIQLANALMEGGISIMEITLRTDAALRSIQKIRSSNQEMVIGAGTVTNPKLVQQSADAGAQFLVSPGVTKPLLDAISYYSVPLLPGIATPSEAMNLQLAGYQFLKFFPAEAAGGTSMLNSLAGPLSELNFCPTGGISHSNIEHYLALKNVICVGSSWVVEADLIRDNCWSEITRRAREVLSIASRINA